MAQNERAYANYSRPIYSPLEHTWMAHGVCERLNLGSLDWLLCCSAAAPEAEFRELLPACADSLHTTT